MDGDDHIVCITAFVEGRTAVGLPVYTDNAMTTAAARGWQRGALPPMLVVYSECAAVRRRRGSNTPVHFAGVAVSTRDARHGTCAIAIYGVCSMYAHLRHGTNDLHPTSVLEFDEKDVWAHDSVEVPALCAGGNINHRTVGTLCAFGPAERGPHRVLIMVGIGHLERAGIKAVASAACAVSSEPATRSPSTVCELLTCSHLDRMQCSSVAGGILRSKIAVFTAQHRAHGGLVKTLSSELKDELFDLATANPAFFRELCEAVDET